MELGLWMDGMVGLYRKQNKCFIALVLPIESVGIVSCTYVLISKLEFGVWISWLLKRHISVNVCLL